MLAAEVSGIVSQLESFAADCEQRRADNTGDKLFWEGAGSAYNKAISVVYSAARDEAECKGRLKG